MFARGFQHGFRKGFQKQGFKAYSRMQPCMNFSQMSMLNKQVQMVQLAQNRLTATNMLIMQMQLNSLLTNDEAETGVSSKSEDVGKLATEALTTLKTPRTMTGKYHDRVCLRQYMD